jgi:hypothetical protein
MFNPLANIRNKNLKNLNQTAGQASKAQRRVNASFWILDFFCCDSNSCFFTLGFFSCSEESNERGIFSPLVNSQSVKNFTGVAICHGHYPERSINFKK